MSRIGCHEGLRERIRAALLGIQQPSIAWEGVLKECRLTGPPDAVRRGRHHTSLTSLDKPAFQGACIGLEVTLVKTIQKVDGIWAAVGAGTEK